VCTFCGRLSQSGAGRTAQEVASCAEASMPRSVPLGRRAALTLQILALRRLAPCALVHQPLGASVRRERICCAAFARPLMPRHSRPESAVLAACVKAALTHQRQLAQDMLV
jgi:hypothetical protein